MVFEGGKSILKLLYSSLPSEVANWYQQEQLWKWDAFGCFLFPNWIFILDQKKNAY